jgi:peptidoglycan hydrolase FlgJ
MNAVTRLSGGPVEQNGNPAEAKLRRTALQLEGMFVQRMFAAMRETVPQDGFLGQSSGEQTFGSMLDEKLAERVPNQWNGEHSLAEALYRQLRNRLEAPAAEATAVSTAPLLDRSTVSPVSTVPPDKR